MHGSEPVTESFCPIGYAFRLVLQSCGTRAFVAILNKSSHFVLLLAFATAFDIDRDLHCEIGGEIGADDMHYRAIDCHNGTSLAVC